MLHTTIFLKFAEIFPICVEEILKWYQNGKNSIRVKFIDGETWVFTYYSDKNWRMETIDFWAADMKSKLS